MEQQKVDQQEQTPLWTDEQHKEMFLWPESPQYQSQVNKEYGDNERYVMRVVSLTMDKKIARGIR